MSQQALALSIRQPWAWLIVHNLKDIENRGWSTQFRGVFYVHAGKTFDDVGYKWVLSKFDIGLPSQSEFDRGGIVGRAEIVACVEHYDSVWFEGPYGFVLKNGEPLDFLPLSGRLGFFDVSEHVKVHYGFHRGTT